MSRNSTGKQHTTKLNRKTILPPAICYTGQAREKNQKSPFTFACPVFWPTLTKPETYSHDLQDFWTQSDPTQTVELALLDVERLGNPLLVIHAISCICGGAVADRGENVHHLGSFYSCRAQQA